MKRCDENGLGLRAHYIVWMVLDCSRKWWAVRVAMKPVFFCMLHEEGCFGICHLDFGCLWMCWAMASLRVGEGKEKS